MIGRPSSRWVSPGSPERTGQHRLWSQSAAAPAAVSGGFEEGHERRAVRLDQDVGADEGAPGRFRLGGHRVVADVRDVEDQLEQAVDRDRAGLEQRPQGPAAALDASRGFATIIFERLGGHVALDRHGPEQPIGQLGEGQGEGDLLLHRLVPRQPGHVADRELAHLFARAVQDPSVLELQEAQVHHQVRPDDLVRRVQEALEVHRGVLAEPPVRHAGRTQHPELPPGVVLAGAGPVGVEQVPLVEHGVGDLPGHVHVGGAVHRDSSGASSSQRASRCPTVSSHEVSPCRAR